MNILFSVHFKTAYGQRLYISGSIPELGNGDISKAVPMKFNDTFVWEKEIKPISIENRILKYRYLVKSDDGSSFYEAGPGRILGMNSGSRKVILHDEWQGNNSCSPFLTAPFTDIFYRHGSREITQLHIYAKELIIRTTVLTVDEKWEVAICGDAQLLGKWDCSKAPALRPVYGSKWEIHLPADRIEPKFEYKFILRNPSTGEVIWENRENRVLEVPRISLHQSCSFEHSFAYLPVGHPRLFGTAIPVFSIRSSRSCGIGDFLDLKPLADWAAETGQHLIQILPVNDTTATRTWTDSYPYGGISVMALHPIYISIPGIGPIRNRMAAERYEEERKRLEALPRIDYEAVLKMKTEFLKIQFSTYAPETFSEPEFLSFYEKNKKWLLPYCAFCTLRDRFGTTDFSKWGAFGRCTPELLKKINSKGSETYDKMSFHIFTQFHLHRQLTDAVKYLHSRKIALKGDLPVGVGPHSADTWSEPELFRLDTQAGAPPDAFSENGQNWGFPTYNWQVMEERHYGWWRSRLKRMSEYFDACRIDHVLGFFRIWEIPVSQISGKMGHFSPALPYSYEEIRHKGFRFDYGRHATPYIRAYQLKEIFGEQAGAVAERYLEEGSGQTFSLKEEYNTQKKIEICFEGREDVIKDGLMKLAEEVLFIEDEHSLGRFHPRISAQETWSYKALSPAEQTAYDQLYQDFFYERHNAFWKESALKKLPEIISATNMLACAEDLGMIPACVPEVLRDLNILSLEIQRMPKTGGTEFADPSRYPYMSVCTTGTHDTSTLRAWWEEDRERSGRFFNDVLHEPGEAPSSCEPWICEKILCQHLHSSSMLTILPLQDWLSVSEKIRIPHPQDERINIPENPGHYWRYRMHLELEQLSAEKNLNEKLKKMIKD